VFSVFNYRTTTEQKTSGCHDYLDVNADFVMINFSSCFCSLLILETMDMQIIKHLKKATVLEVYSIPNERLLYGLKFHYTCRTHPLRFRKWHPVCRASHMYMHITLGKSYNVKNCEQSNCNVTLSCFVACSSPKFSWLPRRHSLIECLKRSTVSPSLLLLQYELAPCIHNSILIDTCSLHPDMVQMPVCSHCQ